MRLIGVLVAILLIAGSGFAYVATHLNGLSHSPATTTPVSTSSSSATAQNQAQTATSTSSATGATSTAGATLSPTAPSIQEGSVLYQADWSKGLNGWISSGHWTALNGQLLSDGNGQSSILAPYVPTSPDYVVEARIQIIRVHPTGCSNVGILVRVGPDNQGLSALANCLALDLPYSGNAQIDTDSTLVQSNYSPGSDMHTYRVEVRGNHIAFFIDGSLATETTDNRFLSAGRVGLTMDSTEIVVASFIVTRL